MRKDRTRILVLLLLLFFTSILLSTASFAWFSANRLVTVETLNIQVATQGGIDISADGVEWGASLSTTDLEEVYDNSYPGSNNRISATLEPVSSGGLVDTTTGYLRMYLGNAVNSQDGTSYVLMTQRTIEERDTQVGGDGSFIVFDIFLRTSSAKALYLTRDSGVSFTGEESIGTENAFRIAFVVQGTVPSDASSNAIQSLRGATNDDVYIWEPNYNTHTAAGVANALNVYGLTINENNSSRIRYEGVIDEITREENVLLEEADSEHHPTKFREVNIDYATPTNPTNYTEVFPLEAGITKVRIYVWLEGQDVDCENNASIGNVDFNVQLSTNPA